MAALANVTLKSDIMPPVSNPDVAWPLTTVYHRTHFRYVGIFDASVPEQYITYRGKNFWGRICIDLCRLRPAVSMYDER
jgi:hypothetical protein